MQTNYVGTMGRNGASGCVNVTKRGDFSKGGALPETPRTSPSLGCRVDLAAPVEAATAGTSQSVTTR